MTDHLVIVALDFPDVDEALALASRSRTVPGQGRQGIVLPRWSGGGETPNG